MRFVRCAVAAVAVVVGMASAPRAAAQTAPTASLGGVSEAAPGELVPVVGEGWPAGTNVLVEVCGRFGAASVDCDVQRSRTVGVGGSGMLSVAITVGVPPSPCPCVVRLTGLATSDRVALPLVVTGAAVVDVPDPLAALTVPRLEVHDVEVHRRGSPVAEWFGLPAQRTLRFAVTNTGTEHVVDVPVELVVGRSEPTRSVAVPALEAIAPGETVQVAVDVALDVVGTGTFRLRGSVGEVGWVSTFETESSTFPWALLIVGLVLIQLALLGVRGALRRRVTVAAARRAIPQDTAVIDLREGDVMVASERARAAVLAAVDAVHREEPTPNIGAVVAAAAVRTSDAARWEATCWRGRWTPGDELAWELVPVPESDDIAGVADAVVAACRDDAPDAPSDPASEDPRLAVERVARHVAARLVDGAMPLAGDLRTASHGFVALTSRRSGDESVTVLVAVSEQPQPGVAPQRSVRMTTLRSEPAGSTT